MVSRVLDATAFYAGIPFSSQTTHYVTTLVFDEIKHIKKNHDALQILIDSNRLLVRQPQADFQERVEKCAQKTGDIHSLSKQDISCIALSLELNTELISDDFAVLNVSNKLGINTIPLMTNGIKVVGKWIFYCPACKKDFSDEKNCLLCGNKLKKKLVKSKY
mgnify:CR=1 FL=1